LPATQGVECWAGLGCSFCAADARIPLVLFRGSLLVALAAGVLTGCSVDRVEWESTGFVVEEVKRELDEKHHVAAPVVECIKREAGGAVWECRARAQRDEFECEVKVGPRETIRSVVCEPIREDGGAD
jgi:hypothetical protein